MIDTYKSIYKEALGQPLELDIQLPSSESESKELIQNLEAEINYLREEKIRRERRDLEDMQKAQELQEKFNKSVPPPVPKNSLIPSPVDPNVVKIMIQIKTIYNDNLDYDMAYALFQQANMKVSTALEQYEKHYALTVKLSYNRSMCNEKFSILTKGKEFLDRVYTKFDIPRTHKIFVYKGDYESKPFDSSTMYGKTLGELEICNGMTLYLLSS